MPSADGAAPGEPRDPDLDRSTMQEAIAAAAASRRTVSPRPWVGAAVATRSASGQRTVHLGATQGRSGPHAEVVALQHAGADARGATLYTTLEPCSFHGKTGPCADAVIEAGIARVVVGLEDPDPRVAGDGIARLRAAGVDVEVGVGAAEVADQLTPYLHHRRTGRPYVVLKLASTLDGRTAAPDGSSRWITDDDARLDAHRLRADCDAVLVGAGTVRTDDPALTVRLPPGEADGIEPLRVVLGAAPPDAAVRPCLELDGKLTDVLDDLGSRGVLQLLVEGGPTVAHRFHQESLVDRYVLYLAPALFGGDDALPLFHGPGGATIGDLWRGDLVATRPVGDGLRIDLIPRTSEGA